MRWLATTVRSAVTWTLGVAKRFLKNTPREGLEALAYRTLREAVQYL